MTRLVIATPTFATQGGVERILESLARELPKRGIDVVLALARGARFHDPARFRDALGVGVECVVVDGTSGSAYGRRAALAQAINDVRPDIVLAARLFDVYPVLASMKAHGPAPRLAVTVQAYEAEYLVDLARYHAFVDLVVTSGNLIANAVTSLAKIPPERVRSIPGGVRPAFLPVRHRPESPLRIGYVGRLDRGQKRILDLPLLVAELERRGIGFTLDIAGDGPAADELRNALPHACFLGWQTTERLYEKVYPELDVLVHFAAWEGITIAPREAMAHGVVPVVSRFVGLEAEGQFVHEENALTFPVGDAIAAADAIERLHRDRRLLAALSAAAMASQAGIRSEDGAAQAWVDAIDATLAMPPRTGDALPRAPRDSGRLSFLPGSVAELVRRARPMAHRDPGSEWPHWSGMPDEAIMSAAEKLAK